MPAASRQVTDCLSPSGLSAAIDPYGHTIARTDFFSPGARVMVAQLPLGHIRTVYGLTGDLFAWLCLATVAIAVAYRGVLS